MRGERKMFKTIGSVLFDGIKRAVGAAPDGKFSTVRSVNENKNWNYPAVVAMAVRALIFAGIVWGAHELGLPLDRVFELLELLQ